MVSTLARTHSPAPHHAYDLFFIAAVSAGNCVNYISNVKFFLGFLCKNRKEIEKYVSVVMCPHTCVHTHSHTHALICERTTCIRA